MPLTEGQRTDVNRFAGFDTAGEVFLSQDRVFRGIYRGSGALYREVLQTLEKRDLFRLGIVATCEAKANPCPSLPYELVLEHEKIPFISYPHEWPAAALKDAALFHNNLYAELWPHGLTLKDWHPHNILFKGTEAVFVDFASIIPVDNLKKEKYLTPPSVPAPFRLFWDANAAYLYEMHRRMFVPYFLLPLYLMHQGQHQPARRRMLETTLNASTTVIQKREVFPRISKAWLSYETSALGKKLALIERRNFKRRFWHTVGEEVSRLNVSVNRSRYTGYYEQKNENFPFEPSPDWTNKQTCVYEAIRQLEPATVLDLAANTGWFSILAARLGCQVVALDSDESCMNVLYTRAKNESLPILPLVVDFTNPTRDVFPTASRDEEPVIAHHFPLLLAAETRLKCDMVLALAIIHHLVLGQNQGFAQVVRSLSALSRKSLVLEFIPKSDQLIAAEPDFFPALKLNPGGFDWYTEENLMLELRRFFPKISARKSSPESRTMLICSR